MKKYYFFILFVFNLWLFGHTLWAQNPVPALIKGFVLDSLSTEPLNEAGISLRGTLKGTKANKNGYFELKITPNTNLELEFSYVGYKKQRLRFRLKPGEIVELRVLMCVQEGAEVVVVIDKSKDGMVMLSPKTLKNIPTAIGDVGDLMKVLGMGVSGNSEFGSAYNVRGGNYDENLIYVNGIEVYRPFLVRAGQQEGLSFVNINLAQNVKFSTGGWQAQFGDKLSSVMDVSYKKVKHTEGSINVGILGGSAHLGIKRKRISTLLGIRHRDLRYLLNTFEVSGSYLPVFSDFQSFTTLELHRKEATWKKELSFLAAYARNKYRVYPESQSTDFGTLGEAKRFFVDYTGSELMNYNTYQGAVSLKLKRKETFESTFTASGVQTYEREFADVLGAYRLCEVNKDLQDSNFNKCNLVLGDGKSFRYSRNFLNANILSVQNRSAYQVSDKLLTEFGAEFRTEKIQDDIFEYSYFDSADFLRYTPPIDSALSLQSSRISAYIQASYTDTLYRQRGTRRKAHVYGLHLGLRVAQWSQNREWLISPRAQFYFRPDWYARQRNTKNSNVKDTVLADIQFRAAIGVYQQAPFYRELRGFGNELNLNLRAQKSIHTIVGMDWSFFVGEKPFVLTAEAYYKRITQVVPYDVENMRLRYYARNAGDAYAYGLDTRINGEFINGTESWFSLSYLKTSENVDFDTLGYIRRPTDQRVTATIFFEDHLPNNPTARVYLRLQYGSGLPFGPPNFINARSVISGPSYRRVDIGFTKFLRYNANTRPGELQSLAVHFEVLNLLGIANVISYNWVQDYINNRYYAVPNRLSLRFFNLRVVANW